MDNVNKHIYTNYIVIQTNYTYKCNFFTYVNYYSTFAQFNQVILCVILKIFKKKIKVTLDVYVKVLK